MSSAAELLPPAPPPRTRPQAAYRVETDFLSPSQAQALRGAIDAHFSHPERAGAQQQVWNYWYVPQSYTYLKTAPEKVVGAPLAEAFHQRMCAFARSALGMDQVSWPFLSLYVEGCGQTLHNDSRNGAFGYVYSLTRWEGRPFSGGETLVFREQDYWASGRFREAGASTSFYELIPGHFNQLLVFDDRLIHGVPEVRGVADPLAGRLVLHGHVHVKEAFAEGPLAAIWPVLLQGTLGELVQAARAAAASEPGRWHGFATCEAQVAASGEVTSVRPLVQRVLGSQGPLAEVPVLHALMGTLAQLRFPPQGAPSRIVVPLFFE